jgi:hypothetical protein
MSLPLRITGERVGASAPPVSDRPIWQHPCTGECKIETRAVYSVGGYQSECRTCRHYGPLALHAFGRTEGETMELAAVKFADELTRYQGANE